jgi:hypothetical protein
MLISKNYILTSLHEQLPCAPHDQLECFAAALCDGKDAVTLDEMLLNVYVNIPVPYAINPVAACMA